MAVGRAARAFLDTCKKTLSFWCALRTLRTYIFLNLIAVTLAHGNATTWFFLGNYSVHCSTSSIRGVVPPASVHPFVSSW